MDQFQSPQQPAIGQPVQPGMMNQNQMTPDMMRALLMGQQDDPRAQQLMRQQAVADQLRKQSMQQPGLVDAGRAKVAPWGQILSNTLNGFQAQRMQPGIDSGMKEMSDKHIGARQGYADSLAAALRRQPMSQPATMSPDGFPEN